MSVHLRKLSSSRGKIREFTLGLKGRAFAKFLAETSRRVKDP